MWNTFLDLFVNLVLSMGWHSVCLLLGLFLPLWCSLIFFRWWLIIFVGHPLLISFLLCAKSILLKLLFSELVLLYLIALPMMTPLNVPGGWMR